MQNFKQKLMYCVDREDVLAIVEEFSELKADWKTLDSLFNKECVIDEEFYSLYKR